jgi:hypothetical protein
MTTNKGRDALTAGLPVLESRRFPLSGLAGSGVIGRDPHGLAVAARPYPGQRPACPVTPHREERCLPMPRYARSGRT